MERLAVYASFVFFSLFLFKFAKSTNTMTWNWTTKKKEEEEEKKRTNMNYSHRMIYDNYRSGSLVSAVSIWYKTRSAIQPRMNSSSVITLEKKATNHRHYSKYNRIRLPIFIFILKIMRKES